MSCKAKSCLFVRNKFVIQTDTSKYGSCICNIAFSSEEVVSSESEEKYAQIKHISQSKQSKTNKSVDFDVRGNRGWTFLLEEVLI